jgi:hypothetical protein
MQAVAGWEEARFKVNNSICDSSKSIIDRPPTQISMSMLLQQHGIRRIPSRLLFCGDCVCAAPYVMQRALAQTTDHSFYMSPTCENDGRCTSRTNYDGRVVKEYLKHSEYCLNQSIA